MTIDIRGLAEPPALRAHVRRRLTAALTRREPAATRAQVTFVDDNGPKGGVAIRCALMVHRPHRPPCRVEHTDQTPRLAFDGAFAVLERQLGQDVERGRKRRRYPKKYFVAARLLRGEPVGHAD